MSNPRWATGNLTGQPSYTTPHALYSAAQLADSYARPAQSSAGLIGGGISNGRAASVGYTMPATRSTTRPQPKQLPNAQHVARSHVDVEDILEEIRSLGQNIVMYHRDVSKLLEAERQLQQKVDLKQQRLKESARAHHLVNTSQLESAPRYVLPPPPSQAEMRTLAQLQTRVLLSAGNSGSAQHGGSSSGSSGSRGISQIGSTGLGTAVQGMEGEGGIYAGGVARGGVGERGTQRRNRRTSERRRRRMMMMPDLNARDALERGYGGNEDDEDDDDDWDDGDYDSDEDEQEEKEGEDEGEDERGYENGDEYSRHGLDVDKDTTPSSIAAIASYESEIKIRERILHEDAMIESMRQERKRLMHEIERLEKGEAMSITSSSSSIHGSAPQWAEVRTRLAREIGMIRAKVDKTNVAMLTTASVHDVETGKLKAALAELENERIIAGAKRIEAFRQLEAVEERRAVLLAKLGVQRRHHEALVDQREQDPSDAFIG